MKDIDEINFGERKYIIHYLENAQMFYQVNASNDFFSSRYRFDDGTLKMFSVVGEWRVKRLRLASA